MRPLFVLTLPLALMTLKASAGDGKYTVSSTLKSATVYRTGAELVHTAAVRLERGANELVIGDVSTTIDIGSIQIHSSSNLTIMSVAFSTDHLRQEAAGPFVKKLQDSIAGIKKELTRLEVLIRSDNELLDLLNNNKFVGSQNTGVTVAELTKLMDYHRQKAIELRTELSTYADRSQQLKQTTERLESQISEEEQKNVTTGGNLVLRVLSPVAGVADLTVSYLTRAAHWEPAYDLKVVNSTDPLQIFYKARLSQTTGINWKQVKLSLSTSIPTQGGNAPVLRAMFLRFAEAITIGYATMPAPALALENKISGLQVSPGEANNTRLRGTGSLGFAAQPLYIINGREASTADYSNLDPKDIKKIDVLKDAQATALYGSRGANGVVLISTKDELGDYVSVNDRTMDAVFDIDIPYDVPGNGMEQGVVLKEYQTPCVYQYYAAPGVDKEAYLLGQLTGWEKLNLLPGEASIMVEGTYIGNSRIDAAALQDTLNLTLGRDKRIVIKKEKVADYSSVKFLGTSKKQQFTWLITVRNNKKEKIRMILKDQYPLSTDKEMEEELVESSGASVNPETGILTWNLELAPGESRSYRISYSVKYPKDKVLNIN